MKSIFYNFAFNLNLDSMFNSFNEHVKNIQCLIMFSFFIKRVKGHLQVNGMEVSNEVNIL